MTDPTIRRFQPGDGERVRELNESAMETTPEYVPDAPDEDLRDVEGHYLEGEGDFLVAVREGTVVGTGALKPVEGWKHRVLDDVAPDALEVTRMRVAPDHQHTGVGSAVYDALETVARERDAPVLLLDTGAKNGPARGFYEDEGFELVERIEVEFEGVELDLVIYRKPLEG